MTKINPAIKILLVIILVILFLIGLVLGALAIWQRTITIRTDDGISYDEIKEIIENRFVPNQAKWSEIRSVRLDYVGYDNIIADNYDNMLFELLYDGKNDTYLWLSRIYYYPNDSQIKRFDNPDRGGTQYRTLSEINPDYFMNVNDIIELINNEYELNILEYFNENYNDVRCSCVYDSKSCSCCIYTESEFNTSIIFSIDSEKKEINFISKSNLDDLNITDLNNEELTLENYSFEYSMPNLYIEYDEQTYKTVRGTCSWYISVGEMGKGLEADSPTPDILIKDQNKEIIINEEANIKFVFDRAPIGYEVRIWDIVTNSPSDAIGVWDNQIRIEAVQQMTIYEVTAKFKFNEEGLIEEGTIHYAFVINSKP